MNNPFKPNLTQTRSFETFKPNSSRVDKLENQILNLRERIAILERDLHFLYRHYEKGNDWNLLKNGWSMEGGHSP